MFSLRNNKTTLKRGGDLFEGWPLTGFLTSPCFLRGLQVGGKVRKQDSREGMKEQKVAIQA